MAVDLVSDSVDVGAEITRAPGCGGSAGRARAAFAALETEPARQRKRKRRGPIPAAAGVDKFEEKPARQHAAEVGRWAQAEWHPGSGNFIEEQGQAFQGQKDQDDMP